MSARPSIELLRQFSNPDRKEAVRPEMKVTRVNLLEIRAVKVLGQVASWPYPHRSMTLWGGKMIPKALFRFDSAHTRSMREEKVPLCDRHHSRMRAEESSFLPKAVFKCASQDCHRYYGRRYGYFDLLPDMPPSPEQIDPVNRQMKVCTKRQAHSYMAITRPKNTAPEAKNLWCWHCFECNKAK